MLREIYRQFPPPEPDPRAKGSAKAIKAGEVACRGKTPMAVREEFSSEARLSPEQRQMVVKLPAFERSMTKNGDFVAGQIGALVYEATLSESLASYGYRGCVYSLARGLEHRLAPRKGS